MAKHTRAQILRKIVALGQLHLGGADLSGLNLSGLTLVGADLSYADLTGTDLRHAQLCGACLWSVSARRADFRGANLAGANLGLAMLAGADLRGAVICDSDLTGAQLDGADLTGAELENSWLDAMQRALAIGAPPIRFVQATDPRTRVLLQAELDGPVTLRLDERLELRLDDPPQRTRIRQDESGAAPILRPVWPRPGSAPQPRLILDALAAGQAQLRIGMGKGRKTLTIDIRVVR